MSKSDVQKILAQIDEEARAYQSALRGLSSGTLRHDVIVAKQQEIGKKYAARLKALWKEQHPDTEEEE